MTAFTFLLLFAGSAVLLGADIQGWRPVPQNLWMMQAFVPPGTNANEVIQPTTPSSTETPAPTQPVFPVGVPTGGIITGTSAAGVANGPANTRPNIPGLPPGVTIGGVPVQGQQPLPGQSSAGPSTPARSAPAAIPPAAGGPGADAAAAVSKQPNCVVRLSLARTELPPSGGEFNVPATVTPQDCPAPISFTATWIQVFDGASRRFAAQPNTTTYARDTLILIGDSSFFVRQPPPPLPGFAAAPSHLVFGINKKGNTDTKRVTAWTEYGTGKLSVQGGHQWLAITPVRGKENRQSYDVTVNPGARLGPGRHDTYLEFTPEGDTASLRIPVVVEVMGKF